MNFPSFSGNWVDLVIIIILFYFLTVGWTVGFWSILSDFVTFFLSLLIALRGYQFASEFLRSNFALSHSISNAIGFLFTAVVTEGILGYFFARLIHKLPIKFWKDHWTRFLGLFPALAEGIILTAFILTLSLGLPISGSIKSDITNSKIGGVIIQKTTGIESKINEIFGGVIEDSLTYLTVKPGSRDTIPITTAIYERGLEVDAQSEAEMFALVNQERRKQAVHELTLRPEVVPVARAHATDMWERQYFGHVSPDGKDVGDRLEDAGINFLIAGENLALAPTILTAHNGLMNSEGHRANILEADFKRVGIGVIDNGVNGKIFVQIFTD